MDGNIFLEPLNGLVQSISSVTNLLPIKNGFAAVKDWGHDIINRIDEKITQNSIINLHKKNIQLTEYISTLNSNINKLENKLISTNNSIIPLKAELKNAQSVIKNLTELCAEFYSEMNKQLLIPLAALLGVVIAYKIAEIILKRFFNDLIESF